MMGIFDAGAGRSSDVIVAVGIDFWSDGCGCLDGRHQMPWLNKRTGASDQADPSDAVLAPEPSAIAHSWVSAFAEQA